MPLYEYRCKNCGDEFEKMVRFSEADQSQACPTCQSYETKKKISSFAALGGSLNVANVSSGSSCAPRGSFS